MKTGPKILTCTITILLISCMVLILTSTPAQTAPSPDNFDVETGFIQLTINGQVFDDFFEVRVDEEEEIYLPLGRIFSELDLELFEIDLEQNFVEGRLPYDEDVYTFDLDTGRIQRDGEVDYFEENTYFVEDDEVYVYNPNLSQWLPMDVDWDLQNMEMVIDLDFRLRQEIQQERKEMRDGRYPYVNDVEEPARPEPQLFSPGSFYAGFSPRLSYGSEFDYTIPALEVGYVGPLLYGNAFSRVNVDTDGDIELDRFTLRYRDIEGMPFDEAVLGDTRLEFSPLIMDDSTVRGALVQDRDGYYPAVSISAEGPDGSDVDLERSGSIVDHRTIENDGKATFEEVPITGTSDTFEVKTYTPDGRLYTEEKDVLLHSMHLPEGETSYLAGLGQIDNDVEWGLSSQVTHGVSQDVTLGPQVMATYDENEEEVTEGFLGGVMTYQPRLDTYTHFDGLVEPDTGGIGAEASLGNVIGNWNWEGSLTGYSEDMKPPAREDVSRFFEEDNYETRYLDWEAGLDASWRDSPDRISLDYALSDFDGERRHELDVDYRRSLGFRHRFEVENELTYWHGDDWENTLEPSYNVLIEDAVEFNPGLPLDFDEDGFDNYRPYLSLGFDRALPEDMDLDTRLSYDGDDGDLSARARYSYQPWDVMEFRASIDDDGDYQLGLRFDLMGVADSRDFQALDTDRPTRGYVEGYAYLELEDKDGEMTQEPLENVGILLQGNRVAETDESGYYRVENIPAGLSRRLELDTSDLDALHLPREESYLVEMPRGTGYEQDFAVVPISGISGFIRDAENNFRNNDIVVQLKDEEGEIVEETAPGFQGFYMFDEISAGEYTVTLDTPEDIEFEPQEHEVEIVPKRIPDWYEGKDFRIINDVGDEDDEEEEYAIDDYVELTSDEDEED